MLSLSERQSEILDKIVREYIKLAEPVSSDHLKKKYRISFSPATLRGEMQRLTDAGYLYQPHTSAGRIPSDKGYRFFVDSLEKEIDDIIEKRISEEVKRMRKEMEDRLTFLQGFSKFLASTSSALTISCLLEDGIFLKEGWRRIFKDPEFTDINYARNFLSMIDLFEKSVNDFDLNGPSAKIYIGKEVPMPRCRDFSMIVAKCVFLKGEEGILAILGPKRMAYDKNILLINSIIKLLKEDDL